MPTANRKRFWTGVLLEALAAAALFLGGLALLPPAGGFSEMELVLDECGWLAISDDTWRLLFEEEQVAPEDWKTGLQQTSYGRINPNFAKIVFGGLLRREGYELPPPAVFPVLSPEAARNFRNPRWIEKQAAEHEPFIRDLRKANRLLMAAAGVGVYAAGVLLCGRLLGVLAWAWFLLTPLVQLLAVRFATDSLLLAMSVASLLACAGLLKLWARADASRAWRALAAVGVGIVLGLTAATKLNGAVCSLAFGAAALGAWAAGRVRGARSGWPAFWILLVALCTVGAFLFVHPVLWTDPASEIGWIVERWDALIQEQIGRAPQLALRTLGARADAVWHEAVAGAGAGLPALPAGVLFVVGLLLAARRGGQSLAARGRPGAWMALVWVVAWLLSTILWVPYSRERYFLPAVGPACLLLAFPIAELLRVGARGAVARLRPRDRTLY